MARGKGGIGRGGVRLPGVSGRGYRLRKAGSHGVPQWFIDAEYEQRLASINRRRVARGKKPLIGKAGDKPGHPFRGNQYGGG